MTRNDEPDTVVTSLTPAQEQRREAVRAAAGLIRSTSTLGSRGSIDDEASVINLATYILTGLDYMDWRQSVGIETPDTIKSLDDLESVDATESVEALDDAPLLGLLGVVAPKDDDGEENETTTAG